VLLRVLRVTYRNQRTALKRASMRNAEQSPFKRAALGRPAYPTGSYTAWTSTTGHETLITLYFDTTRTAGVYNESVSIFATN
jgi:hypothetical protein